MAKLVWDALGERFFETGLDRGVLYVDGSGIAWPGLITVSESPTGGEPRPFYIDGIKYLNLASAEEFEATIEAFSSPPEFGPCDGTLSITNGLFATQQPRKPFDFAYRTRIGNDVDGDSHAYKIHVVYGALAAPSSRSYQTQGDSPEPTQLSWKITTLPPRVFGLRPTSHFVIDSRFTDPATLVEAEGLLYGTDMTHSALPPLIDFLQVFVP